MTLRYIGGEELVEDKGYVSKFVCTHPFQLECQTSGDKDVLVFLVQTAFLVEGFMGCFQVEKGRSESPSCICSF